MRFSGKTSRAELAVHPIQLQSCWGEGKIAQVAEVQLLHGVAPDLYFLACILA